MLLYVVVVGVLWPVPVLNILHVESAAVVALAAYFIAGLHALPALARGASLRHVTLQQEAVLLIPWLMLTISLLWAPNCGYLQGLLFFGLFPALTVPFAVAMAYWISAWKGGPKRTAFVAIGLAIMTIGPLYDVGLHPQLYSYNHIFGGVLGPIYDEELALRPGLFAFRGLTLLWTLWLVLLGRWWRGQRTTTQRRWWLLGPPAVGGLSIFIGLTYLLAAPLGINTPERALQSRLGGHLATEHFDLYFDPEALSPEERLRVAREHEYHYARLSEALELDVDGRIASYIYPSPEVKGALTGARQTNVAPVWLASPQLHLLQPQLDRVFPHELAHVFSREFGLPAINASLAVGLVEGFAVAMEPPDGQPDAHEMVATGRILEVGLTGGGNIAVEVAERLSPLGFWSGRGGVSYTTMGSFVRYLIEAYGIDRFKRVYAWGRFESVYGKPVEELTREWQQYLSGQPLLARASADRVLQRFSVPSLFERRCPHYVPHYVREYRAGREAHDDGEPERALALLEASLEREPAYGAALNLWARVMLAEGAEGASEEVIERLEAIDPEHRTAAVYVRLGEAYALEGWAAEARGAFEEALQRLPQYQREATVRVLLRAALADEPSFLGEQLRAEATAGASIRHPAAQMLRALALMDEQQHEEALALLEEVEVAGAWTGGRRALIEQQRLSWMAAVNDRMGRYAEAALLAERAAALLRDLGDRQGARHREAFAEKLRWFEGGAVAGAENNVLFSLD